MPYRVVDASYRGSGSCSFRLHRYVFYIISYVGRWCDVFIVFCSAACGEAETLAGDPCNMVILVVRSEVTVELRRKYLLKCQKVILTFGDILIYVLAQK